MAVSDARLLRRAAQGDPDAANELLLRHTGLVGQAMRDVGLSPGDRVAGLPPDDASQAGLLGLWSAILTYRPASEQGGDRPASFSTYARRVVANRIRDAIRAATSRANEPLNLGKPYDDEPGERGEDATPTAVAGPAELPAEALVPAAGEKALAQSAMAYDLGRLRAVLTDQEYGVLIAHLSGRTYPEIAYALAISYKSVDGAMQRIRKKARALGSETS